MTHDESFLAAILESPDDDAPRLVYADWLDEHGQPERAEFIRVQCELACLSEDDPQRRPRERRERDLLDRHQDAWLGQLRPLLSRWVFRRGFLDEVAVHARVYLEQAEIPCPATVRQVTADLAGLEVPVTVLELMPGSVARENVLLPLGFRGTTLVLAMRDPQDTDTLTKICFILNREVAPVPALAEEITEAIERVYRQLPQEAVTEYLAEFVDVAMDRPGMENEMPVVRLANLILQESVGLHASQIHIEPQSDHALVLYRINGELVERDRLPRHQLDAVAARLRIMASLNPVDHGAAFSGWIRLASAGEVHEFEITITPTPLGPRIVLALEESGYEPPQ
jgi:uncharacterized protein (TIGR02996 family)